jgi:DNA end-binding protein Ku
MGRAIWTGSLSFGLVSVPVGLYSATEDKTVRFNQFQAGTPDRVRNRRVNERTGEEVEYRDIVKGFDVGGGEFVVVTPEELEAVEPEKSRTISVTDFVDLDEIDPVYFQRTYYLAPHTDDARRAYALLLKVMSETKKVGIATFVMRSKEYLVAVRPGGDVLALETMFFSDEIRDPAEEIEGVPVEMDFTKRELETAKLLIDSMTTAFEAENYHDTYRESVEGLVERKRHGEEIVSEPAPKKAAPVVNLAEALQRSIEVARERHLAGGVGRVRERAQGSLEGPPGPRTPVEEARPAERRPGPTHRSSSRDGARDELSGMSKVELYERATELDVSGRSKMSRLELEAAVRAAGGSRRRRAS